MILLSARRLLDLLLPPLCPGCDEVLGGSGGLCLACWRQWKPLGAAACLGCALPAPAGTRRCAGCAGHAPAGLSALAAVAVYQGPAERMVLRLKHAGRLDLAPMMAAGLGRAAEPLLARADRAPVLVVPVPSHPWRRLRRRANPAAELARPVAAALGLGYRPGLLVRRGVAKTQGRASRAARTALVRQAFAATGAVPAGAWVLLIDDVVTTGATLSACAQALRRAGAAGVLGAGFARVLPWQAGA